MRITNHALLHDKKDFMNIKIVGVFALLNSASLFAMEHLHPLLPLAYTIEMAQLAQNQVNTPPRINNFNKANLIQQKRNQKTKASNPSYTRKGAHSLHKRPNR